ncbi:MAG: ECF transporter S component [Clostridia bacterium]|nr:ECF transporter S component [Clostridia bacterium]
MKTIQHEAVKRICLAGLFTAMNVALSSFGLPVPGGHLYLNDIVICTAALLLDPISAFVAGGVGAFLGDLFFYPTPMFVSLVTHGAQAVAVSCISRAGSKRGLRFADAIAVTVGAIIMIVGYSLGRAFIYSTPAIAIVKLPYQILQAAVGAVFGLLIVGRLKGKKRSAKTA